MKKSFWLGSFIVAVGAASLVVGQTQAPAGNSPTVNVGSAVAAKAASPVPGPTAKNQSQQTSIGKGMTSVKASAPSSYWTDLVDIDDDGIVEDNQFLWDAKRGMLYTYREDNFNCADGKPENGDVLMAVYSKGNTAGKPIGSGWFVVGLKPGQCGEKKGGTFGCRFDVSGKPTTCGATVVKEESGEIEIMISKGKE
jgi:hypothetical protein